MLSPGQALHSVLKDHWNLLVLLQMCSYLQAHSCMEREREMDGGDQNILALAITHLSTSPTVLTAAAMFSLAREGRVFVLMKSHKHISLSSPSHHITHLMLSLREITLNILPGERFADGVESTSLVSRSISTTSR